MRHEFQEKSRSGSKHLINIEKVSKVLVRSIDYKLIAQGKHRKVRLNSLVPYTRWPCDSSKAHIWPHNPLPGNPSMTLYLTRDWANPPPPRPPPARHERPSVGCLSPAAPAPLLRHPSSAATWAKYSSPNTPLHLYLRYSLSLEYSFPTGFPRKPPLGTPSA